MKTLFPFQETGVEWLYQKKVALLADEMGLGKTPQAIRAADRAGALRLLIVCPAAARINWAREFRRFDPARPELHISRDGKNPPPPGVSGITSYDLAVRFQEKKAWGGDFDIIVLDEAHFLKSLDAKRTQAILGREGLVRRAGKVWALTGTPMPNHPGELWIWLRVFGRTTLNYRAFTLKFCEFAPGGGPYDPMPQIVGAKKLAIPELRRLLAPIMLRRKKEDVLKELPPISFGDVIVERGKVNLLEHASFLPWLIPENRTRELAEKLAMEEQRLDTETGAVGLGAPGLQMLEAMAGSVATLRRYVGLQKVPAVIDMIKFEFENDLYKKIVIFAIHRDVIEWLRRELRKFRPVTLYGKTDPERRQKNIDRFQTDPKCKIFIGNIMAAGTAITLTAAHNVLFIEQDWVPANNAQAAMRCHRIGQEKPVTVRFVGLADSIDERITYTLKRKTRDIVAIFDGTAEI